MPRRGPLMLGQDRVTASPLDGRKGGRVETEKLLYKGKEEIVLGGMRNGYYRLNKTDPCIIFEAVKRKIKRKKREETEM